MLADTNSFLEFIATYLWLMDWFRPNITRDLKITYKSDSSGIKPSAHDSWLIVKIY